MGGSGEAWDAVVVGASFAGLATALELAGAGRVAIVDRRPVGEGQTSACATPLAVLERLDLLDCVEQVHEKGVAHLPDGRVYDFAVRYPFATFDYERFCRRLFARTGATFLQATALGLGGPGVVLTSAGDLRAPVVVDASGWRAALAGAPPPSRPSVGFEVRLAGGGEGLHFWFHAPQMRAGYIWDFPAGDHRRAGIIAFGRSGGLKPRLEGFLGRPLGDLEAHGGGLPARLRAPVGGRAFVVGDAAGQCLPLTGEGIRPALVYGAVAGRLAGRVLAGTLRLERALAEYRRFVLTSRLDYTVMALLQAGVGHMPRRLVPALCWLAARGPLAWAAQQCYWSVAPHQLLAPSPQARPASVRFEGARRRGAALLPQADEGLPGPAAAPDGRPAGAGRDPRGLRAQRRHPRRGRPPLG